MNRLTIILEKLFHKDDWSKISVDITALDGICIARSGDTINEEVILRVENQKSKDIETERSINESEIYHHSDMLLDSEKYRFITHSSPTKNQILNILSSIRFNDLIIEELHWLNRLPYHYHHCLAVALMVTRIMFDCYEDETEIRDAASSAFTHDIGISRVPPDILKKVSSLKDEEIKILREHPVYSYLLLTYYLGDHQHPTALIAYTHHEDPLGKGYPRGIIQKETISQCIRMCDNYDALISDRPFRPALKPQEALEEIEKEVDENLDRGVFTIFKDCLKV